VTHTVTSADPRYQGLAVTTVTAFVADNDTAGILLAVTDGSTEVAEGGATDTYTVVLTSRPTADVTVTVSADGKLIVTPDTLTFTPDSWNVPRTVTVAARDDGQFEGPHGSTLTHRAASGDDQYDRILIADVAVTVADNDTVPTSVPSAVVSPPAG